MIIENLSTLKIHKLTQEQYDRELSADKLDENALYLTPDKEIDLSPYVTKEQIDSIELITVDDIDTICGASIQVTTADNVAF